VTIGGLRGRAAAALCACALAAPAGAAQGAAPPPDTSGPRSLLPDIGPDALLFDGTHAWIRPIIGVLADYSWFGQEEPSLAQVGAQADQADLRAARFGVAARLKRRPRLELAAVFDYIEPKRREDVRYELLDLTLGVPIGDRARLTIGKQKQPFAYEMVALAALLPHQERILSPFFVSRDVGVRVSGRTARDRLTFWAGWYNDWWTTGRSFGAAGNDYAVRLTGQPLVSADYRAYVHVGLAGRYTEAEDGVLRFRGRPESNVTDYYIDTGDIPATAAALVGVEILGAWHQWSLLGEWVRATVHRPEQPSPQFWGAYATASWIVTGEHRPYERAIGGARSPAPAGRLGAWEVVARYAHADAADVGIDGGVLDKWYLGVNWWATLHWKAGAGYGVADLTRDGLEGRTRMGIVRLQWLY
jgi:phosphate-selective porin OprO/OprP